MNRSIFVLLVLVCVGCQSNKSAIETAITERSGAGIGLIYSAGSGQAIALKSNESTQRIVTVAHVLDSSAKESKQTIAELQEDDLIEASFEGRTHRLKVNYLDRVGDYAELESESNLPGLEIASTVKVPERHYLLYRMSSGQLNFDSIELLWSGLNLPLAKGKKRIVDLKLEDVCLAVGEAKKGSSGGAVVNAKGQLVGMILGRNQDTNLLIIKRIRSDQKLLNMGNSLNTLDEKAAWLIAGFLRAADEAKLLISSSAFDSIWQEIEKKPSSRPLAELWRRSMQRLQSARP